MKPRSPAKRKTPTAVPDALRGISSESIAPGGTPANPRGDPEQRHRDPEPERRARPPDGDRREAERGEGRDEDGAPATPVGEAPGRVQHRELHGERDREDHADPDRRHAERVGEEGEQRVEDGDDHPQVGEVRHDDDREPGVRRTRRTVASVPPAGRRPVATLSGAGTSRK